MTAESKPSTPGPLRPWWTWFWRGGLVLLAVVVVLWLLWWWAAERRLAAVEQAIVDAGLPKSMTELKPPVAPSDNAASWYEAAYNEMEKLSSTPEQEGSFLDLFSLPNPEDWRDWTPADWEAWRVTWRAPGFATVRHQCLQAAELAQCRWFDPLRPFEWGRWQVEAGDRLQVLFLLALHDPGGDRQTDPAAWSQTVWLSWCHARHQLSAAVGFHEGGIAWRLEDAVLEVLIESGRPLDGFDELMIRGLTECNPVDEIVAWFHGERLVTGEWFHQAMDQPRLWQERPVVPGMLFQLFYTGPAGRPIRCDDLATYLEVMVAQTAAIADRDQARLAAINDELRAVPRWRTQMAPMFLINATSLVDWIVEREALHRLVVAGLTMEGHRQRTGSWPESIAALGLERREGLSLVSADRKRPVLPVAWSDTWARWGEGIEGRGVLRIRRSRRP